MLPFLVLLHGALAAPPTSLFAEAQWGQWRGPMATGVAPKATPPIRWSEQENLCWKTALTGVGHGTPVVWGDQVILTAAEPVGPVLDPLWDGAPGAHDNVPVTQQQRFVVMAFGRDSGALLWKTTVHEALPHAGGHSTGTVASASPVTDGEHIVASFGSEGLYGLSMDGTLLWSTKLGQMATKHGHGEGAGPVLHGELVALTHDHEGASWVGAFDKRTGVARWRTERDEVTSWATPITVRHGGVTQLVVPGTAALRAYDLATGEVLWHTAGLSHNVVASPVAGHGMVFSGSSYDTKAMLAVRLGGTGDVSATHVAWRRKRGTPYVPSPLLVDDALYYLGHYQGVMSRVVATTGAAPTGPFRLERLASIYASPVSAAGRIYVTDLEGNTAVLEHGPELKPLARNELDDRFSASAALVGDQLFLRGERSLYCVSER